MNPKECVCVFEDLASLFTSVCLINDYSLMADLYIFVYGRAECATISLECTKVKLLILNNFGVIKSILERILKMILSDGISNVIYIKVMN